MQGSGARRASEGVNCQQHPAALSSEEKKKNNKNLADESVLNRANLAPPVLQTLFKTTLAGVGGSRFFSIISLGFASSTEN